MDQKDSRPTIRDVAREANVSYQTVSRVLNNHPKVATATRERVLLVMKQLGFQRNLAAQMLTTQRSQTIEIITVDGKFPFVVPILNATQGGYFTIYSECTAHMLPQVFDMAAARMVEGIFLYAPRLRVSDDELLEMSHGIPLVRRDYFIDSRKISWVGFDQVRAARLAVEHLLELGHREIVEITGLLKAINPSVRHEAIQKTLLDNGLELVMSVSGDYTTTKGSMKSGYEGMSQLLESGAAFTAVIVANDSMAIGAMHAIREYGLQIPDDISIVGFDNAPHAQYLAPPLTTVHFDFEMQNRLVFQFLLELIKNPDREPYQHVLLPNLVVRASTRSLA